MWKKENTAAEKSKETLVNCIQGAAAPVVSL